MCGGGGKVWVALAPEDAHVFIVRHGAEENEVLRGELKGLGKQDVQ